MLLEPGAVERAGALDVDPAQPVVLDDLDVGLSAGLSEGVRPARARAPRLSRGFGRFGIASERVVEHRGQPSQRILLSQRIPWLGLALSGRSCSLPVRHSRCIQRGGGTWPLKPRQPLGPTMNRPGTVPIPSDSRSNVVREMWQGRLNRPPSQRSGERFSISRRLRTMPSRRFSARNVHHQYPLEARYVCERCFGPLEVALRLLRSSTPRPCGARSRPARRSIWRYADFLPFAVSRPARSTAGMTPLERAPRLAERARHPRGVRQERHRQPHALVQGPRGEPWRSPRRSELGYETVACASTGNLANAVAAHAAAAGLESYVFIPSDLEEQKVLATGVYGTNLVTVRGSYDDVNRLCTELSAERDWAFVNVNVRPYYAEGSKTLALRDRRAARLRAARPASWRRSPPARCSRRSRAGSRSGSRSG